MSFQQLRKRPPHLELDPKQPSRTRALEGDPDYPDPSAKRRKVDFTDLVTNMSACLAILSVSGQQTFTEPTSTPLQLTRFEPHSNVDFQRSTGVALNEILYAFALIFSATRFSKDVTATLLQENPNHGFHNRPQFTLYVARNSGLWNDDKNFNKHKKQWEEWTNNKDFHISFDFNNFVWKAMWFSCRLRIYSYSDTARDNTQDLRTYDAFQEWKSDNEIFSSDLNDLLKVMRKTLGSKPCQETESQDLVQRCWNLLDVHGRAFDALRLGLQSHKPGISIPAFTKPHLADCYLKSIENFAKLPRAFHNYVRFRSSLVNLEATFKIKPISPPKPSVSTQRHTSSTSEIPKASGVAPTSEVMERMVELSKTYTISSELTQKAKDETHKPREESYPHCEIQVLYRLENLGVLTKAGMWKLIGCSKRPCYSCDRMIKWGSEFQADQSHEKKTYCRWSLPEDLSKHCTMQESVRKLHDEVLHRVSILPKLGWGNVAPGPERLRYLVMKRLTPQCPPLSSVWKTSHLEFQPEQQRDSP
ncbi:hypothetical protein F5B20DRAFT_582190 [Whalleya microplaca]|nr:hypothetical protein F5B20DRAFT_582190 [Whalleya microplaca]